MDHLIIDAYNVIYKRLRTGRILKSQLQSIRSRFLDQLTNYIGNKNIKVTVVFDGQGQYSENSGYNQKMDVVFSSTDQTADEVIIRMIRDIEDKNELRRTTVVSSDIKDVFSVARNLGVHAMRAEVFWPLIDKVDKKSFSKEPSPSRYKNEAFNGLREDEIDTWMDFFKSKKK